MHQQILEITTTTETEAQAHELARRLIESRLAACVQIIPHVRSHYRWRGHVCDGQEYRLSIKSIPEREADILLMFEQHHPYELPEFLVATSHASSAYAAWVHEQVLPVGDK